MTLIVFPIFGPLLFNGPFLLLGILSERLILGVRENEGTLLNEGEFCDLLSLLLRMLVNVSC